MKRQAKQMNLLDIFEREQTCKGCGALILWVTLPNGKSMPLNADPLPIAPGHYVLGKKVDGRQLASPADSVHLNHWATCPEREQFRRGKN